MNVSLPIPRGQRVLPDPLAAVAASWLSLTLIVTPVRAEFPLPAANDRPRSDSGAAPVFPQPKWDGPVPKSDDVVLGPGGVLQGRIVCPEDRTDGRSVAGLRVALLRAAETVATTVTDVQGKFAFQNVRGGFYRVLIDTAEEPRWRPCRLWTPAAAPPHASDRLSVLVGRRLVRGQSPLPIGRLPRAATVAAIAAGAIVPPIIYHGVKRDDYIPASP